MDGKNRLANFIMGKSSNAKTANPIVTSSSLKQKYVEALDKFQSCFKDNWSDSTKRENYLDLLKFRLNKTDTSTYNNKYSNLIELVLKSHINFGLNLESLKIMELSLTHPSNTTLKRFDAKKDDIHKIIINDYAMGREVLTTLVSDKNFTSALDLVFGRSAAAELFVRYYSLTRAEYDYFDFLCKLRENTKATSQVHSKDVP